MIAKIFSQSGPCLFIVLVVAVQSRFYFEVI